MKNEQDLDSADWLCFFTKTMINKVNPNIIVNISIFKNNDGITTKRLIHISNISEDDILKLKFLTNTNVNNNYLYLEYFGVEINNGNTKLNIPGLKEILIEFWRYSDSCAFEKDEKFFQPFSDITNINKFIDDYSNLHSTLPITNYFQKTYVLILNPDCGKYLDVCDFDSNVCCSEDFCWAQTSTYKYCAPNSYKS
jgi:hypothetical protein